MLVEKRTAISSGPEGCNISTFLLPRHGSQELHYGPPGLRCKAFGFFSNNVFGPPGLWLPALGW